MIANLLTDPSFKIRSFTVENAEKNPFILWVFSAFSAFSTVNILRWKLRISAAFLHSAECG